MQTAIPHLTVIKGPDLGRHLTIPAGGATLGRSSRNDLTLNDPVLSRQHCRFDFEENTLQVADLESANGTLVNNQEIKAPTRLKAGDQVLIGNTLLVVTHASGSAAASDAAAPTAADAAAPEETTPAQTATASAPVFVDLGFNQPAASSKGVANPLRPLLWIIAAATLLILGAALIMRLPSDSATPTLHPLPEKSALPLEIYYEKVEGDTNSIFRYAMRLTPDMRLAITIDDLSENRHVREETIVQTNLVRDLARTIEQSDFFNLDTHYEGIARGQRLATWDITIIQGRRAKQCRVTNRVEPQRFQTIRELLETFGKNELGIWAIQFSREKLIEMAHEAFTRACNLFDERGIAYGNTANAIARFDEAAFYLQTIDPKPDFFGELVSMQAQAREELDQRYEEQRFVVERAINLKEWSIAARELRILREMIPDQNDPRHSEATSKLLDVENRLQMKGRP